MNDGRKNKDKPKWQEVRSRFHPTMMAFAPVELFAEWWFWAWGKYSSLRVFVEFVGAAAILLGVVSLWNDYEQRKIDRVVLNAQLKAQIASLTAVNEPGTARRGTLPILEFLVRENVSLNGMSLAGVDLTGANLSGGDLRNADLAGAILVHADLSYANLEGANLTGANLSKATLAGAIARRADFSRARIIFVDLTKANFSHAIFKNTDLSLSDLSDTNATFVDWSGANLEGVNISGADLRADLAAAVKEPIQAALPLNERTTEVILGPTDGGRVVNLTPATITQQQINITCIDDGRPAFLNRGRQQPRMPCLTRRVQQ
ncbi:pentapeptide repeat-containing protein [Rhodospirillaceae bacterium KN72]|uniref:Pentapeptide repeat-containing protein n=1 Tax=Pacificispira spongiicola TaxID=2729598 RepID=A0A7Y0HDF3_9PROT|nr:pentapeptide repeat-containing protein [Pacificispira spongiicola]NMM43610.1 pentapeptide repeat-containing protein [Pacificispira spongiicola]